MTLFIWTLATAALIGFAASALIALVSTLLQRTAFRIAASARARLWEAAAALPLGVAAITLIATFLPAVLLADHCHAHGEHHPHLCPIHTHGLPAPWIVLAGLLLGVRIASRLVASVRAAYRAALLPSVLGARADRGVFVLRSERPLAFVLGILRPRVFVSEGMLDASARDAIDLDVVLAHERGHAVAHHPLRRLIASLLLSFHLPGVADWIEERIALAHEEAADAEAAREVGDRLRVADAIVQAARMIATIPSPLPSFGGGDVEARVRALLGAAPTAGRALPSMLGAVTLCAALITLAIAPSVHHAIETMLGWLHA